MRIKIKYLKLHNFLSFEDGELGFNTPGYTLVQGVNKNVVDMAVSNGSGKSTIFEAIAWCLTGELIRGGKNVKRIGSDENDSCWVSLEFDVDNVKYGICRQANPSKLSFIVDGKDESGKGIRDTEKIIQEYLPSLTSSLIGSVMILGQGLPQRFSNNTPSGRKEVLETLSNSDAMLADLKCRITRRSDELFEQLRNFEDELLQLTTRKEMAETEIESLQKELDSLPNVDDANDKIFELKNQLSIVSDSINSCDTSLVDYNAKRDGLIAKEKELQKLYKDTLESESSPFDIELADLHTAKTELQALIKSKTQEIKRLKDIKDVCPTCGQKLPNVEKIDTSALESEVESLKISLDTTENRFLQLTTEKTDAVLAVQSRFESEIYDINMSLNEVGHQIDDTIKSNISLKNQFTTLTSQISELESQLQNRETLKDSLEKRLDSANLQIEMYTSKILYIDNEKEELRKHIDIIQKMKTVIQRDFRGYLLSSVIAFINRKAKEYSQEVFESDKVDFSLDGNNINIGYDDKEYSNLSGGERQKIDLIIQFAIRDMLCTYLDFSSNILVVDELFDNLDSVGCERILNFISNKLNDVESVYIITHHSDIPIPFDNILTVTKGEDGITRIN